MTYAAGSLVRARGREWVVLPESDEEMLIVRPLGGTREEETGIYLPLEPDVESAQFGLPEPTRWGDERSCRLLRDAVRLGFRASSGPFRSFAHIGVEPRPYQLVPLLLALRQDPVRLLIADNVGIGKTVEAGLVVRELLDRREVERLVVLCPPHLTEQWQAELREKFHNDAVTVLSSTVTQLERVCSRDESIFDRYDHLIISLDFITSDRRRETFLRVCPELVIMDEAHTCAYAEEGRGARHQSYQLIQQLAEQSTRHLILVSLDTNQVVEALFEGLLAGESDDLSAREPGQMQLPGVDDMVMVQQETLFQQWDASTEREKRSRTLFAQYSIRTDEVERELYEARETIGSARDVASFTRESLISYGAFVSERPDGTVIIDLQETPMAVQDALDVFRFAPRGKLHASFTRFDQDGVEYLTRTHPLVEGLAAYVMDTALDSEENSRYPPIAGRCGLIRTNAVQMRTTLLLVRLRFHIHTPGCSGREIQLLLAEESCLVAFRGSSQQAGWFDDEQEIARLRTGSKQANTPRVRILHCLRQVLAAYPTHLAPHLEEFLHRRAEALYEAHRRVRRSTSVVVRGVRVDPHLPPDVFGMYVYVPDDERG